MSLHLSSYFQIVEERVISLAPLEYCQLKLPQGKRLLTSPYENAFTVFPGLSSSTSPTPQSGTSGCLTRSPFWYRIPRVGGAPLSGLGGNSLKMNEQKIQAGSYIFKPGRKHVSHQKFAAFQEIRTVEGKNFLEVQRPQISSSRTWRSSSGGIFIGRSQNT